MERQVYKIFGKVLITNKPKVTQAEMLAVSLPLGLYVPEELCYEWLFEYLQSQQRNFNSTFYQSWQDIVSRNRWELFIDQVRHYASTYGTDFQGKTWLPEHTQLPAFPFKELKVVEGIDLRDAIVKIKDLAYSNVAMTTETLDFLVGFQKVSGLYDISQIKNRELKLRCIPDDYKFTDGQECLLWILWKSCNITMLVKNKEVLATIGIPASMKNTIELNRVVLASVFHRNKDVFMQFKKTPELKNLVNRIRKLADKHHKPMEKSPWLMLDKLTIDKRFALYRKASIFKLVQIYNALANPTGYYVVRNGKAYYREGRERTVNNALLREILTYAAAKVADKHNVLEPVALPNGIELAMPMSEKSFIGEIPMGSYVDCAENNTMIGIYWRNEWGARDLDLHAKRTDGVSIGWNTAFRTVGKDVVFSGDMTNADPEATEVMWFKQKPMDAIISVSEYSGESKYNYDIFISQEFTTEFGKNYMVDPRNVIYRTNLSFENARDVTLGFFQDGKFVFHSCQIGKGIIPNKIRTTILNHLISCHYLTVREVLERAGITISDDAETKLTSKGDLLEFFS